MIRTYRIALASGALSLAACQQQPAADEATAAATAEAAIPAQASTPTGTPMPAPANTNTGKADPVAGENDGYPDLTPAEVTPDVAKTEKGARAILLPWARGIELREFDQSWAMMGDAAQAQISKAKFNAMFHPLRDITVAIPGGDMEGAAGSIYYTVPTTVTGTRADGSKAVLKGDVVMRRVNDVDGATPEQLKWHIAQVNLKPV